MTNSDSLSTAEREIRGQIGYFGLEDWWLTEFSKEERQHILNRFRPFGVSVSLNETSEVLTSRDKIVDNSKHPLISGNISFTNQTAVSLLSSLAAWFSKESDRPLAHRILEKAEEVASQKSDSSDKFWLYHHKIEIYYKDRTDPSKFEKAIEACYQQINVVNESGDKLKGKSFVLGYQQLAIIFEKQGKYDEAIDICNLALDNDVKGDWKKE